MKNRTFVFFLVLFISLLNARAQGYFENITKRANLSHLHVTPYLMGGGISIIDINNDGWEDVYFTGGFYEDKLFVNNGDKTFTRVEAGIFDITRVTSTTGAFSGDINNDGFEDILVTTFDGVNNILFLNNGDNTFRDITKSAGITDKGWGMGATFGDFNLDGLLDIYIINYIDEPSVLYNENNEVYGFSHDCFPNRLYINNGNLTFDEVSSDYLVDGFGCGLAVTSTDVDNDNIPDIYLANDFGEWITPNKYYKNNYPELDFSELSQSNNLNLKIYGMGIATGDYNRDGLFDYYVTNLGRNVLLEGQINGEFSDMTTKAGVENTSVDTLNSTSWGTDFFDYDNDGYEDLVVSNGFIKAAPFLKTSEKDPNKLYRNNGDGTFEDVSILENISDSSIARGVVTFDFDNDGDLDIIFSNIERTPHHDTEILFYENLRGSEKNWLKIKLKGDLNNHSGIGAKVKLFHDDVIWIEEITGGSSHASSKSKIAHFGLGLVSLLDSIQVIWPGGMIQIFKNIGSNQTLLITESNNQYDIVGCLEETAENYNSNATFNYGCVSAKVLGTYDEFSDFEFNFYPNPVYEVLVLNSSKHVELNVTDISGKNINSISGKLTNYPMDVRELKNGVYFIKSYNSIKKFIKK